MRAKITFQNVYWACLVIFLSGLVVFRRGTIWPGDLSSLDKGLLAMLVVVLLAPLFTELEGFGFKLRREVSELKTEVSRDLAKLEQALYASVAATQSATQSVLIQTGPASNEVLENLVRQLQRAAPEIRDADVVPALDPSMLPHDIIRMFEVRWSLEQEVIRIARRRDLPDPIGGRVLAMVTALAREGAVLAATDHAFREIYKITSSAIHGQLITSDQQEFVLEAAPKVLAALRAVG
jgi:hypothetical protein